MKSYALNVKKYIKCNCATYVEVLYMIGAFLLPFAIIVAQAEAQVKIPGADQSAKLKTAGTLLLLIDTVMFVWMARILAGLCVLSAGWAIKEQKFGPAVIAIVGALVIGTSPAWVMNIFEIGGGGGVFH